MKNARKTVARNVSIEEVNETRIPCEYELDKKRKAEMLQRGNDALMNAANVCGQKVVALPIDVLVMPNCQRDKTESQESNASMQTVKRIAASFDMDKLGFLIVYLINGVFYIADGAHRARAAKLCGETHVPCVIVTGKTMEDLAFYFATQDRDIQTIKPRQRMEAAKFCQSADDEVIQAYNAVRTLSEDYGIQLERNKQNPVYLSAPDKAVNIVLTYGKNALRWMYDIIIDGTLTSDKDAFSTASFTALSAVYECINTASKDDNGLVNDKKLQRGKKKVGKILTNLFKKEKMTVTMLKNYAAVRYGSDKYRNTVPLYLLEEIAKALGAKNYNIANATISKKTSAVKQSLTDSLR